MAFTGVALVTLSDAKSTSDDEVQAASLEGDMLTMLAAALYAGYTVVMRKCMPGEEAEEHVATFFGYVGLFSTVRAGWGGDREGATKRGGRGAPHMHNMHNMPLNVHAAQHACFRSLLLAFHSRVLAGPRACATNYPRICKMAGPPAFSAPPVFLCTLFCTGSDRM